MCNFCKKRVDAGPVEGRRGHDALGVGRVGNEIRLNRAARGGTGALHHLRRHEAIRRAVEQQDGQAAFGQLGAAVAIPQGGIARA